METGEKRTVHAKQEIERGGGGTQETMLPRKKEHLEELGQGQIWNKTTRS